ncbi:unnamed protein product [Arabidopsis lyrata]|nr:unnamed protein product [Arabidopsis lyrata]
MRFGDSCFRVVIFDVSASEIDYPLDKVYVIESDADDDDKEEVMAVMNDNEQGFTGFETSDDDGVIDLDDFV